MSSKLSARVQSVKPSATLAITARAKALRAAGKDVVGLGAGEPDFDTPDHIKEAAIKAIRDGFTKYTPVEGTVELRRAIVEKFKRENGFDYQLEEILVSCGGKQSFYNLAQAILDPGDEVIIPAPYWVSYPDMSLLAGGVPVIVDAGADQNFKITPAQLEAALTERTALVVINSPSNPTGMSYSHAELAGLGEVLRRHPKAVIATDDMYEHIRWSNEPFVNILNACPDLAPRTLVLNGVSKAYSMTGWRIGYAGGPEWLIKAMGDLQSQSTSNPCSISQYAVAAALNGPQDFLKERNAKFKERRDLVVAMLNDAPGLSCPTPEGAFYVYPDASGVIGKITPKGKKIETDADLIDYFLEDWNVAAVHGAAFGLSPGFRISYATSNDALKEACTRIQSACAALV